MEEKIFEKNKNFSKKVSKSSNQFREYIIDGQISSKFFSNEESLSMQKTDVTVNQFKKLIRKSLYNFRVDIHRHNKSYKKESKFDESCITATEYIDELNIFFENYVTVLNFKMIVKNVLLYEVLNSMEQHQRDILYMSLCEKMSDRQIGDKLKMSRAKVQRNKQKAKRKIFDGLSGGFENEK